MAGVRKETTKEERQIIINMKRAGKSVREIGKLVGRSHSTVAQIISRFNFTQSVENGQRTGRKATFSKRDERKILDLVRENPKTSAPKLASEMENIHNKTIHPQNIRRVLWKHGYHGRVPRKKPFISDVNSKKRIEFAEKLKTKDFNFWKTVIFTDESKFNIFGADGRGKVWRKSATALELKHIVPTIKHGGGSVMVWGSMSASGVGKLVFINGNMDRWKYLDILKDNLKPSVEQLGLGPSWIFQQDNDPKHTAHVVKEWILYNVPNQLHSPPQSPDLNPIEHLWDHLERQIRKYRITSKKTLQETVMKEWDKISPEVTKKLIESMPRRLEEVIKNKGGPTRY